MCEADKQCLAEQDLQSVFEREERAASAASAAATMLLQRRSSSPPRRQPLPNWFGLPRVALAFTLLLGSDGRLSATSNAAILRSC